jgi:hypothetical protein
MQLHLPTCTLSARYSIPPAPTNPDQRVCRILFVVPRIHHHTKGVKHFVQGTLPIRKRVIMKSSLQKGESLS